jgi:hypothetical protein
MLVCDGIEVKVDGGEDEEGASGWMIEEGAGEGWVVKRASGDELWPQPV